MKNDSTTMFLNVVLAAFVILGVMFALFSIWRMRDLRHMQPRVQAAIQQAQSRTMLAQQLMQDTVAFNNTAKSPELAQIIREAQTPAPAAK
jgi:hypothetical protein